VYKELLIYQHPRCLQYSNVAYYLFEKPMLDVSNLYNN
jgi:hypothetical protein